MIWAICTSLSANVATAATEMSGAAVSAVRWEGMRMCTLKIGI